MRRTYFFFIILLFAASTFGQPTQSKGGGPQMPKGWGKTGSEPQNYEMHQDTVVKRTGNASVAIKSTASVTKDGFASVVQSIRPDEFRGKRVRLSGYLKTAGVAEWGGLWLRIDGADPAGAPLDFDNMENRPVKGTSDWRKYEIVLDVSPEAEEIVYGFLLKGSGQMWADDFQLEAVGKEAVKTSRPMKPEDMADAEEFKKKDPKGYEELKKRTIENRAKRSLKLENGGFEN